MYGLVRARGGGYVKDLSVACAPIYELDIQDSSLWPFKILASNNTRFAASSFFLLQNILLSARLLSSLTINTLRVQRSIFMNL